MALVRVYCGLASADPAGRPASAGATLTSAVVDDAGRLLHVCDISDDPSGYARLGALLVERASGPSGAAIATDSDDHMVASLLIAAGRPLAIADDDSVDDFAERFADDDSAEERESPAAARRAVGLARALQAGALSAVTLPAPRELAGYQPVLAAHAALANGRHSAAVTLREVLRELYPAALRAYPDPAEPLCLAVLDALPEPGMIGGTSARGRETSVATDAIAAHLAADGVADAATINEAVTALRVAIAETPRRGINKAITSAVAETVRQAVAAVRACDAAGDALVATLNARTHAPAAPGGRRSLRDGAAPATGSPRRTRPGHETVLAGRRSRPEPVGGGVPVTPAPIAPPPVAPAPIAPPPMAPRPVTAVPQPGGMPISAPPAAGPPVSAPPAAAPAPQAPAAAAGRRTDSPANRPVSAPPPPPGITPISSPPRGPVAPVDAGEPFRATLTTAALNSARNERQRPTPIAPRPKTNGEPRPAPAAAEPRPGGGETRPPAGGGFGATDLTLPMPAPRPQQSEAPPPGSRANWPLAAPSDDRANSTTPPPPYSLGDAEPPAPRREGLTDAGSGEGRVTPPWLADDMPPEPPVLRLVDPSTAAPAGDHSPASLPLRQPPRAMGDRDSGMLAPGGESRLDVPPLRLVGGEEGPAGDAAGLPRRRNGVESPVSGPPVPDEGDGDLLIFAAARSAWFTREEEDATWSSTADSGWRAAEQAAKPSVGASTSAGLPKRVPQANLVPGSPLRDERPLRIVRDAARIAEHTTGYFRGWRRGQEIGGFAVGGRPGREAAGGWDFSREPEGREERDYQFRSAGYRS